jgi:hypothetical protein
MKEHIYRVLMTIFAFLSLSAFKVSSGAIVNVDGRVKLSWKVKEMK